MSSTRRLLALAAAVELATGVTWTLAPRLAANILLAATLSDPGIVMARVAGLALLSLGIACWPVDRRPSRQAILGLLTYNLFVAGYLAYVGATWAMVGVLLWPAVALHLVLGIGLGASCRRLAAS